MDIRQHTNKLLKNNDFKSNLIPGLLIPIVLFSNPSPIDLLDIFVGIIGLCNLAVCFL